MIKTNVEIEKFRFLQEKVDKIVLEKQQEEVDYGEIPEEFKGQIISVIRKGFQKPFPPFFLMNELVYVSKYMYKWTKLCCLTCCNINLINDNSLAKIHIVWL